MKIGGLLKRAYILHGLSVNEKLKKYDMTMSQLDVLIKVTRANEKGILIHQRDIEKKTNLSNPTVTGLINRLENKELIQRIENDKDKRVKNLFITEKTKSLNKEWKYFLDQSDSVALQGFSQEEKRDLENYLERIIENLKKGEQS